MAKALEKKLNNWKPTTNTNYLLYQNQGFLIYQNKALYNGKGIYNNQADKELFMKRKLRPIQNVNQNTGPITIHYGI